MLSLFFFQASMDAFLFCNCKTFCRSSDSLAQSLRLKLPLPSAAFLRPLPLANDQFGNMWRSMEMQEDAVRRIVAVVMPFLLFLQRKRQLSFLHFML